MVDEGSLFFGWGSLSPTFTPAFPLSVSLASAGNFLISDGKLAILDFGMMAQCPPRARFAIIAHVVHLVNRDYAAMSRDYYALDFLDPSVDVRPIVPALAGFFDDVLGASVSDLNFKKARRRGGRLQLPAGLSLGGSEKMRSERGRALERGPAHMDALKFSPPRPRAVVPILIATSPSPLSSPPSPRCVPLPPRSSTA